MRITEGTIASNYLFNVGKTRDRIVQLQSQLASTKRVLRASDDPQAADTILRLTESLRKQEQYAANAAEGLGMADTTAVTLGQFADVLVSLKELAVNAENSRYDTDRTTFAERADQLLSELFDIGNTRFNGKFIFGGTQTTVPPYTMAADRSAVTANPAGLDGIVRVQLGDGIAHPSNVNGEDGLQGTAIYDLVVELRDAFAGGTFTGAAFGDRIDAALDHVLNQASYAASLSEHFQAVTDNLDEQQLQLQQYLSLVQDTDIAEATMKLKHEEIMLDAALNTGGRIIPKSLLDFLR
ncbi:MAG: hypothetical protein F9K22_01405 [Bacteroidetes bacterium]|nr:MAG: hypothetical protein F9K22_01405 [Bacteroidota bacterium]